MASRWLVNDEEEPTAEVEYVAPGAEDVAESEVRASIMRQVVVRTASGGGKRSWKRPPIESEPPRKHKPTAAERAAQIATVAAAAAASAAATAAVSLVPQAKANPQPPSSGREKDKGPPTAPTTPPSAAAPHQEEQHSSMKNTQPSGELVVSPVLLADSQTENKNKFSVRSLVQGPSLPDGEQVFRDVFGPRSSSTDCDGLDPKSRSVVQGPRSNGNSGGAGLSSLEQLRGSGDGSVFMERSPELPGSVVQGPRSNGDSGGVGLLIIDSMDRQKAMWPKYDFNRKPHQIEPVLMQSSPELPAFDTGNSAEPPERSASDRAGEAAAEAPDGRGAERRLADSDAESSSDSEERRFWEDFCASIGDEQAKKKPEDHDESAQRGVAAPKAKGKAKGKGKGKAKAKAKASAVSSNPLVQGPAEHEAEPKAKAKAKGKANAKAEPKAKGKAKGKAKAAPKAEAKAKAQAKAKAAPGTAGTFAGRRPPVNGKKQAEFDELKAHYLQARLEAVKTGEEPSGSSSSTSKVKVKRRFSPNQEKYWTAMKKRMQELAQAGVPGPERMSMAASDWKAAAMSE